MYFFDPHRLPIAAAAIIVSCLLGIAMHGVIRNANPLTWQITNVLLGRLGDRMDKTHRPRGDLVFRGFLLMLLIIAFAAALAKAAELLLHTVPFYGVTEILILTTTISTASIWVLLLDLYKITESGKAGQGVYYTLAQSARYNLANADPHTVNRAAIGYAAQNFSRALVLPVIFYLLFGIQVAIISSVIAASSWRFGKAGFSKGLGALPLALEWLIGIIPSIVSAILLALAAIFTPKSKAGMLPSFAPYAQGGMPVAVMAKSLNISLGGAFQDISGSALKVKWIGPKTATAKNEAAHLRRAAYQLFIAHILLLLVICGLYLANTEFSLSFILDFIP
jgi:adenosylcobinamide-phosphate synthase